MKKLILLAMVIGLIFVVANISIAQDHPTGFRGITWGTDFSDVKDEMVYSRTDKSYGGIERYLRKNDEMMIGAAKVDRIEYEFWQNKFYGIFASFSEFTNYSSLKGALFERFGEGYKPNPYIAEYYWFNFAEGHIVLKYSEIQKKGFLMMYSKELNEKAKQYQIQKDKEGAKKGF